jgi:hypothetical protein
MIRFKEYVLLREAKFRKSKQVVHLKDYPMFSLFYSIDLNEDQINDVKDPRFLQMMGGKFQEARRQITAMGFPSMHSNVVIMDLSDDVNQNTGKKETAGYSNKHYMAIGYNEAMRHTGYLTTIIVHEWAHDFMRKKSKAFKKAVMNYYKSKIGNIDIGKEKYIPKEYSNIKDFKRSPLYDKEVIDNMIMQFNNILHGPGNVLKKYIFKRRKMNRENLQYIPNQTKIPLTLKNETYFYNNLTRRGFDAPSGSKVYAWNNSGDTPWILTVYDKNDNFYDIYTDKKNSFEELLQYVVEDEKEIFKIIKSKVKDADKEELKSKILSQFTHGLERALRDLLSSLSYELKEKGITIDTNTRKWKSQIEEYAKENVENIIYPKFLKLPKILDDPKKIYDELWSGNELKAPNKSFADLFYPIVVDSISIKQSANFSGKEYDDIRDIISKMNVWHSAYGLSNEDEIWATAIDNFFKLPIEIRREIVSLMMVN